MPLTNPTLFYNLLGPYATRAQVYAYRPTSTGGKGYIDRYEAKEPQSRITYGTDGNGILSIPGMHQYDPAARSYAFYAMTGDEAYLTWANSLAVAWRDYAASAGYKVAHPYAELLGVALHYAATGDESSRFCIGSIADWWLGNPTSYGSFFYTGVIWIDGVVGNGVTPSTEGTDCRQWTRGLMSCVYAHAISAPSPGIPAWNSGGFDHGYYASQYLTKILNAQYPDGAFRTTESQLLISGTDYTNAVYDPNQLIVRPFYVYLLCNAFIDYERLVGSDSRLWPAIRAATEYCFEGTNFGGLWDATSSVPVSVSGGLLRYIEASCGFPDPSGIASTPEPNTPNGASALAGWPFRSLAGLYHRTGLTKFKTWFDQNLAGQSTFDFLEGSPKFLNENYSITYNAFPDVINAPVSSALRMKWS